MNFSYVLQSLEKNPYIWSILNHGQISLSRGQSEMEWNTVPMVMVCSENRKFVI